MIAVNFEAPDEDAAKASAGYLVDLVVEDVLEESLHYVRFFVRPIAHTGVEPLAPGEPWIDRTPYPPSEEDEAWANRILGKDDAGE